MPTISVDLAPRIEVEPEPELDVENDGGIAGRV